MHDTEKPKTISVLIVDGVAGRSLYVNDYRVSGPKPWGGGTVSQKFEVRLEDLRQALGRLL